MVHPDDELLSDSDFDRWLKATQDMFDGMYAPAQRLGIAAGTIRFKLLQDLRGIAALS